MTATHEGDDGLPHVAEVFDELRRFHVYDHDQDDWVMSGCDFGGACVIEHKYDAPDADDFTRSADAERLVAGEPDLSLVWEDGERGEYDTMEVPLDDAAEAADPLVWAVADELGVDRERVRVVSLEAPNEVAYFVTGPEVGDDG